MLEGLTYKIASRSCALKRDFRPMQAQDRWQFMQKHAALTVSLAMMATPNAVYAGVSDISFLNGWRDTDGYHYGAIKIELEDGWKTYWRSPQGAGIPPILVMHQAHNITDVQIMYPRPNLYWEFGEQVLGYTDGVTFPIRFKLDDVDDVAALQSELMFGVCKDVCVPMEFNFAAQLSADDSQGTQEIRSALADGPKRAETVGAGMTSCQIIPDDQSYTLSADLKWSSSESPVFAVVEYPNDAFWVTPVETHMSNGALGLKATVKYYGTGSGFLQRDAIRVSILTDSYLVEFRGC